MSTTPEHRDTSGRAGQPPPLEPPPPLDPPMPPPGPPLRPSDQASDQAPDQAPDRAADHASELCPDDRALPPGPHGPGVDAQLREMARLAASLTQEEWWRQPESALLPALAALDHITASLDAARLQLVGRVDHREVHGKYPVPGTAALLRTMLRWRPAEAARMRRLAGEVPGGCEEALTALAQGEISLDHTRVIHDVVGRMPPKASEADRTQAVNVLIDAAPVRPE